MSMFFIFIVILGIFLDLYSKSYALKYFIDTKNILDDFLYLKYVENTGIAFSIKLPYLKYITIVFILGIFYYFLQERKKIKNKLLLDFSFGLILAGAIGNGIERVLYGKVIDFIGVKYFSVFNLADSFISIGILIYLIFLLGVFDHNKEN